MDLSKEQYYEIAKIIDDDFVGSFETFTATKKDNVMFLTSNRCDYSSLVRVTENDGRFYIERLGPDTGSWQEINPATYKRISDKFGQLNWRS
jgi:hypothetical protein